jgi:hypothetical protein
LWRFAARAFVVRALIARDHPDWSSCSILCAAERASGEKASPTVAHEMAHHGGESSESPAFSKDRNSVAALQTIGQRYDEISIAGLEDELVKTLRISPEERNIMLPSGNQRLISNRLNWARSYLSKAGLIELPRRGYCRATDRGRQLLAEGVSEIDVELLGRYPEFVAWRSQTKASEVEE